MSEPLDDLDLADEIAIVDAFLGIVQLVRAEKPRDPLGRLTDVLLDLRAKVGG